MGDAHMGSSCLTPRRTAYRSGSPGASSSHLSLPRVHHAPHRRTCAATTSAAAASPHTSSMQHARTEAAASCASCGGCSRAHVAKDHCEEVRVEWAAVTKSRAVAVRNRPVARCRDLQSPWVDAGADTGAAGAGAAAAKTPAVPAPAPVPVPASAPVPGAARRCSRLAHASAIAATAPI